MRTANETYQVKHAEVLAKIEQLRELLTKHSESQSTRQLNWGFVGDLETVANHLQEAVDQLAP